MMNCACGSCSTKKKRESVLRLNNHTPEKFQLWKDLEGQIKAILGKYEVELENIVYDYEKHTKSFTILYDTTENVNKALMTSVQFVVENGIELEIVSSRGYPNDSEKTSMYKAEALIDDAERSIEKLQSM